MNLQKIYNSDPSSVENYYLVCIFYRVSESYRCPRISQQVQFYFLNIF